MQSADIPPLPEIVADYVHVGAEKYPDRVAIIFEDRLISYRELNLRSSMVAQGLTDAAVRPGDRVAYVGRNSAAALEILFGGLKARAIFVSLNWRLSLTELAELVADCRASLIFADREWAGLIKTALGASAPRILIIDEPASYAAWRNSFPPCSQRAEHQRSDYAVQLYTSGTTGRPKGVLMTNANLQAARQSEDSIGALRWRIGDVSLVAAPLFHIGGLGWALSGLARGATIVLLELFRAPEMLHAIVRHGITQAFAVPAVIDELAREQERDGYDLSSLRLLHYGAAPIAPSLLARMVQLLPRCGLVQHYGMTEACGTVVLMPPAMHSLANPARLKTLGPAMPFVDARVVDDDGKDVEDGRSGELWFRGSMITTSRWQDGTIMPAPLHDGWYATGDIGRRDGDGCFTILDRKKDMIISGGENIYPAEVERVLAAHFGIAECAVIGVPDARWGEAVKAIIVTYPGHAIGCADVRSFLVGKLAGYKIPKSVDIATELPRTPSGKIRKDILREPYWAGMERGVN